MIGKIFAADEGLSKLPSEERYAQKNIVLKPLLDEYWKYVESIYAASGSNLAKAVTYSLNKKTYLNNVLLNGELELTNNCADASAKCYSIIESASLNDLNVFGCLSYLLTELPKLGEKPTDEQLDYLMPSSEALSGYCKNI